ncbi:MAG: bifunctional [glutamine synthetase] adenylyltransferase/[glutamine synthetase]-adenylyl-L-tyrosine phosphorylase [Microbacteriaceae bacterium]
MADAKGLGLTELAKLGFVDLESTLPKLDKLVAEVGDAGRSAFAWLSKSANPDQALNGLLDLCETSLPQLKKLLKQPESAQRLIMTIGASSALIDLLRRAPALLSVFEKSQRELPSLESMTKIFTDRAIRAFETQGQAELAWNAIRLAYREELLRVSAFDVSAEDPLVQFPVVSAHLADMAGAALDAALSLARLELVRTSEHGYFTQTEVDDTSVAVLAMGKCGARELNYISDVDVIFVADSAGSSTSVERALEIATKLVTRMMRALDANSTEPALWQVDPNLRPEGKSGALVRTLESHLAYYDRWAQNWEFQALLKARPVAGDKQLGFAYVESTQALVWTSSGREGFVESAQKMRERVMEYIPTDEVSRQIKLGPGGLRDIEFTVQLLQLVHGRTDESVRVRDTLSGIRVLRDAGYIAREDAISFDRHYRFLRLLEHRIQLSGMRRTHLMPTSDAALRALARATGFRTAEELLKAWESVKSEVRSLHQKVFYRPLLSAVAKLEENELALSSDQAEDRLRAIGFLDPGAALRHIQALTSGLSRRAAIQKSLLPVLLQWFAEGSEPDIALLSFRRLSEDLGDSPWFLKMLRDSSGAAQRLSTVLSLSRLATSLFERIPEAAAWLESVEDLEPRAVGELQAETEAILERHEDIEKAASTLRGIRRRETLRLALGAVVGNLKLDQLEDGLTQLFEVYLKAFLKLLMESGAAGDLREELEIALVAMGRFGGGELGFGSDADVMFVYRALKADGDSAQKSAERVISELRRLAADPVLEFELDLDLRPEGKNGPIARSLDSYAAYYERWANTWESQALLRARVIAGSDSLSSDFEKLIDGYRYPVKLDAKAIIEIRRIKARVETERLPQGADPKRHLKLGRGSLSDVEWLVQVMQLEHGYVHENIRTPKTLQALEACVTAALIDPHDARVLREAWVLASRVRSASVLWANKRSDVLPNDRRALEGMARILEYPPHSASALEQDYLAFTRRSRMVFERLFYGS